MAAMIVAAMLGATGCQTDLTELLGLLENFEININTSVNQLQTQDPRDPNFNLPGQRQLMITDGVDLITDPSGQIDPDGFDDSMLVGFQNTSGWDMYVEFEVDAMPQSIYVFDGETVLLEYPCAQSLEVVLEEDYDPLTYDLLNEIDWTGTLFANPDDFDCGAALIVTLDGTSVNAEPDLIDLGFMMPGGPPPPPPPPPGPGPDDGMDGMGF